MLETWFIKRQENICAEGIKKYFEGISEFFHFDVIYLRNFSSGETDKIKENYEKYEEIIKELKTKIEN